MKKLNLLLATTAITAMATTANAELNVAADSLTANIDAAISIVEPATIQGGKMLFPTITTAAGDKIVINADGTVNESQTTAQVVHADQNAYIEPVFVSGGAVGYASGITNTAALQSFDPNAAAVTSADLTSSLASAISFQADPITMTDVSNNNSGMCGTVKAFTKGTPVAATRSGVSGAEISYGATFELASGFHPTNGFARCTGTGTVTYFPNTMVTPTVVTVGEDTVHTGL